MALLRRRMNGNMRHNPTLDNNAARRGQYGSAALAQETAAASGAGT
jgi:hypothetical protein